MAIIITSVKLSKNKTSIKETVKFEACVMNSEPEPTMHRLPFKIGGRKGGIRL